jgi:hypothetical protein
MSASDSRNDPTSLEQIAAHTQEMVDAIRANQREIEARIAETTDLIGRTQRLLRESEIVEPALSGRSEEP